MDYHRDLSLLAGVQAAIIVAKSRNDDGTAKMQGVKMPWDEYLAMHRVDTKELRRTIDALVTALDEARDCFAKGSKPTMSLINKMVAALALARKGG